MSAGERVGSECALPHDRRRARLRQQRGVGGLVLIERVRIGHQDRRAADHRELAHRRGAGAGDHEMRGGDARRQVGKELGNLGREAELVAFRGGAGAVLAARLQAQASAAPAPAARAGPAPPGRLPTSPARPANRPSPAPRAGRRRNRDRASAPRRAPPAARDCRCSAAGLRAPARGRRDRGSRRRSPRRGG